MRKNLAEEQLPEKFTLLEAMMDATYCCGDSLTLADFYVYGLLNWIGMNTLDGVPHTIILECGSASQSARSRRWRSGRRDSVGDPRRRRDVLYAQVNNAVYHFYIDDAVNLHLARSGVSNDVRRFTSENSCRYLRQLSWPTPVEIGMRVRLGRASAAYQLGLFAEGETDASAIGTFTHIYVDDRGKPCRMDEGVRAALEPLVPDDGL